MSITRRNYTGGPGLTKDYRKVRAFLVKRGYSEFPYARWDWMITHSYLDESALGRIGLWEDDGAVVGLATYDTRPGTAYCVTLPAYAGLKKEMLAYAETNLKNDGPFKIVIPDHDPAFQAIAAEEGFIATPETENDAVFYIGATATDYTLPEGFRILSLKEHYDAAQYRRVLWKGFNHELNGEGPFAFTEAMHQSADREMLRDNVDLDLKIAVIAPDGNYASYCGLWYEPACGFAVIEPLATDPAYRRLGLGKAAVLEGIRRVEKLGASYVTVGSNQQFYYSIGLRPYATYSVWIRRPAAK